MTSAVRSNFSFLLGSAASPQALTALEEVLDASGIGVLNELIEVTNFDSGSSKEYIAGLADGQEFTLECNYIPNATGQELAITAINNSATRLFEARYTGVSPEIVMSCSVVCLGYEINPAHSEQDRITFTFKISGALTYTT